MRSLPFVMLLSTLALTSSIGCSTEVSDGEQASAGDALAASQVADDGFVTFGVPAALDELPRGPRYRARRFGARAGDRLAIVVSASAALGDPVAYVLDGDMKTLATNDDAAPGRRDAFIAFDVPADSTYFIAVRDKTPEDVRWVVSVRHRPSSGTYVFPGTCRASTGWTRPVKLHADFTYAAGGYGYRAHGDAPKLDAPGNLAQRLVDGGWVDAADGIYSNVRLNGGSVGAGESWDIKMDLERRVLEARWQRSGQGGSRAWEECSFDVSAIFSLREP